MAPKPFRIYIIGGEPSMPTFVKCSVAGCTSSKYGHGLCSRHYRRLRSRGKLELVTDSPCLTCGKGYAYTPNSKRCPSCRIAWAKEADAIYARKWKLEKQYKMTPNDYETLLDAQQRECAICKTATTRPLQIDHDHETGAVRGLLCFNCNTGLGNLRDSEKLLRSAIQYLQSAKQESRVAIA